MNHTPALPPDYYSQQFDAGAMIPDHPIVFTRWLKDSAHVRRMKPALFDLAYGELPGERLDFFPSCKPGAPLLVFIHGGWWRSLDKSDFSFIAPGYTTAGFNVAMLNYTLAPEASIKEITQQNLRALAWLYRHADHYEFDRSRIVVAGHSAGAHLAAMMMTALWPVYGSDLPLDLVKGGVLLSGLYDLDPVQHAEFVNIDLKLVPEDIEQLSPAFMPQSNAIPFITAVGGKESDEFKRQNGMIGSAWRANHRGDIKLPEANHMTICDAFASPDHPVFDATVALLSSLQSQAEPAARTKEEEACRRRHLCSNDTCAELLCSCGKSRYY